MAEQDRRQIALTHDGKATLDMLTQNLGWFGEEQEAGRFALGYAVREGVEPGQAAGGVETGWSTDGFDPTGEIRNLLRAMYPDNTTPVRLMGYLVDEGLRRISAKIDEGNDSPLDFLD